LSGDLRVIVEAVEQHGDHRADHLQMAELLGGDVHEQVIHFGVLFSQHESLGEVLQGGGQFRDSERATKSAKT
jgi:hypothetical protein